MSKIKKLKYYKISIVCYLKTSIVTGGIDDWTHFCFHLSELIMLRYHYNSTIHYQAFKVFLRSYAFILINKVQILVKPKRFSLNDDWSALNYIS